MPNSPKTPTRTFRCEDALWNAAKEKTAANGTTITDVLRTALVEYVADEDATE